MLLNELRTEVEISSRKSNPVEITSQIDFISAAAQRAMLFELSASPKPGLVDRYNNGAHKDMNYFSFIESSVVLSSYYQDAAKTGSTFSGNDFSDLLNLVRQLGIKAEKKMFLATGGINTHKGQIFSLGLLSAATGYTFANSIEQYKSWQVDTICNTVSKMCNKIIKQDLESLSFREDSNLLTYGERLYLENGITGIRGEAESGFHSVRKFVLPAFKEMMVKNPQKINEHMIQSLLYLMRFVEDSNVLGRGGGAALKLMRDYADKALKAGGIYTIDGKQLIMKMDQIFIKKNISPGGCADLLAVLLFLFFIEQKNDEE